MKKYYCDRCRLLYDQIEICKACGSLATKVIIIEVQRHKENN